MRNHWNHPPRVSSIVLLAALGGCVEANEEETPREETSSEPRAATAEVRNRFEGEAREAALAEVERLKEIQSRFERQILDVPGVFGIGIGYHDASKRFVFTALVDETAKVPDLPANLEGVPLVTRRDERPVAGDGGSGCIVCHGAPQSFPVEMGNSGLPIGAGTPCSACTMGFKACNPATGEAVFVTAAHCSMDASQCPASAATGTPVYHPSPGDNACVAASNVGSVWGQMAPVPFGTVDATVVDSDPSQTQLWVRDIGVPDTTIGVPLIGDDVRKSGRTTGLTNGVVTLTNVTVSILYNCAPAGGIVLTQQVRIDSVGGAMACTGGDSGAGWFNDQDQVIGLHVAGNIVGTSCYANNASNVLGTFGLTMDFTPCMTEVCPVIDLTSNSANGLRHRSHLYQLRDEILGRTELGKTWIRRFYEVAPAWVALYASHPNLFRRTRSSLDTYAGVIEAVANGKPVAVDRARVRGFLTLIDDHIAASEDNDLDAALGRWRAEVLDPEVQAMFQVTLE